MILGYGGGRTGGVWSFNQLKVERNSLTKSESTLIPSQYTLLQYSYTRRPSHTLQYKELYFAEYVRILHSRAIITSVDWTAT